MRKMKEGRVPCCLTRPWKFAATCIYAGKQLPTSMEYRHVRKQLHNTLKNLTFVQSCGSEFLLCIQLSRTLPKVGKQLPDRVRIEADCDQESACWDPPKSATTLQWELRATAEHQAALSMAEDRLPCTDVGALPHAKVTWRALSYHCLNN